MRRTPAVAVLVSGLLACLLAAPAGAHSYLAASDPPDGATVEQAPSEIRLEFNEPVGTDFAQVQVTGPDGTRLEVGEPVVDGEIVTQALAPLATPGGHTVAYRVVSGDGHPIEGSLAFEFAPPGQPEPPREAEPPPEAGQPDPAVGQASPGVRQALRGARLVNYLSLALVIGFLLAAAWLLSAPAARRQAARVGAVSAAAWLLSALVLFVLALANAAALSVAEALDGARLAAFAQTRFGVAVLAQAAVAAAVAVLALGRPERTSRVALAVAGVGALAPALWGHAVTADLPVVAVTADWVHVLGAGAWVGGLAALVSLVGREPGLHAAASRFSRLAGVAIVAVGVSGLVHLVLHTDELGQLTGTSWGRLALFKIGLLVVLAGFGWVHRSRTLPGLGDGRRSGFRRFAAAELLVMLVALGVAGSMASGMPAGVEAAARIKSLATPFADGHLNLVVDPGVPGPNEIHLYFFAASGEPAPVTDPTVTFEGETTQAARLFNAGPGHFVDPRLELPAAGYRVVVTGAVQGHEERATTTVTLP